MHVLNPYPDSCGISDSQAAHQGVRATLCLPVRTPCKPLERANGFICLHSLAVASTATILPKQRIGITERQEKEEHQQESYYLSID